MLPELKLGPLPLTQIQQLLSDALHRSKNDIRPLAELVIQKTSGNPFLASSFLKSFIAKACWISTYKSNSGIGTSTRSKPKTLPIM
ncbi:MAG: putative ATPase [Oleiphilaceae bacterium]|jgi:predicted ATPase